MRYLLNNCTPPSCRAKNVTNIEYYFFSINALLALINFKCSSLVDNVVALIQSHNIFDPLNNMSYTGSKLLLSTFAHNWIGPYCDFRLIYDKFNNNDPVNFFYDWENIIVERADALQFTLIDIVDILIIYNISRPMFYNNFSRMLELYVHYPKPRFNVFILVKLAVAISCQYSFYFLEEIAKELFLRINPNMYDCRYNAERIIAYLKCFLQLSELFVSGYWSEILRALNCRHCL